MIIDCISDLHGYYPKLEGGDLLIVAGDLTSNDRFRQMYEFGTWIKKQPYHKKIVIAGNHDVQLQKDIPFDEIPHDFQYLCDSGTEFEGLKIWGSPWTKTFEGMNPKCKAFTFDTEEELDEKWKLIHDDVDILITHSPPHKVLDRTVKDKMVGSSSLGIRIQDINPKIHCFGHIHEDYGILQSQDKYLMTKFINCSHVNEKYQPVNKPVRVIL